MRFKSDVVRFNCASVLALPISDSRRLIKTLFENHTHVARTKFTLLFPIKTESTAATLPPSTNVDMEYWPTFLVYILRAN